MDARRSRSLQQRRQPRSRALPEPGFTQEKASISFKVQESNFNKELSFVEEQS